MAEQRALTHPIPDLLQATRAEITALLHDDRAGAPKITLRAGRLVAQAGDEHEYVFECRRWNKALVGKDLLIRAARSKAPWERAVATRSPDGKVRVVTAADLGQRPEGATLTEDETSGWEVLADRLAQAGDSDSPLKLPVASWVFGLGRPRIDRCSTPARFIRGYAERRFNARQRAAVEQALSSEITFVWGPPGTGKTEVVSAIVEGCYRQGHRVLFVAPTKVAVDQALERVCALLACEDGFDGGLVQRAGDIAVASLTEKYGDQIVPERVAERLGGELDSRIAEESERLDGMRGHLAVHEEYAALLGHRDRLAREMEGIIRALSEIEHDRSAALQAIEVLRRQITDLGRPSGLFAQRKAAKLAELQAGLAVQEGKAWQIDQHRQAAIRDHEIRAAEFAAARSGAEELGLRVRDVPAESWLRTEVPRSADRLKELRRQRQQIAEAVRGRCRVMGTTVSKAVQTRTLMDGVDVVVIDEAGMVNLPSAWFVAGLAGKRVVLAGDFRQLPAITHGSSSRKAPPDARKHSREWMDRDAFHAAGLVDESGRARPDARMVCLNEQYRMRHAICAIVNEVAYRDSPLATGRSERSRLPSSLVEEPLVLVDTSSRRVANTVGREAHKSNPVHEAVIHELIRGLQYDGVLPARKHPVPPERRGPTDSLGIITPYRNQVNALGTSLRERFGVEYDGLVDTVHRFQGSQRPMVIIDTVAGAGSRLGFFYEDVGLASTTTRLLNVALSRAQDHLVVVADVEFLRRELPPHGEAARMLRHLETHAQRLPVEDLVPVRAASDLGGLDEKELARPAFFPADEVARAVAWDIARAETGIDVYCAFLNDSAVRKWRRLLARRISEGVRVTVHTRPPEPGSPQARLIDLLRGEGCQVTQRERMHEKILILDDTVLWHGSLNLLAHSGSTDLMMRMTDRGACERVRRIIDAARMDRPARTPRPRGEGQAPRADRSPSEGDRPGAGDVVHGRLYVSVPFDEKDEFKSLVKAGGNPYALRWHNELKLWSMGEGVPRDLVSRWLP
ncbi:AAA domain-containing protein [Actinomadura sp. NPDC000600]|uniref:AAA domain-containing protein n=1 Tax=Actinomadura sp. NPDC000600 TaxID=3154262 RepID=UPI00339A52A0